MRESKKKKKKMAVSMIKKLAVLFSVVTLFATSAILPKGKQRSDNENVILFFFFKLKTFLVFEKIL